MKSGVSRQSLVAALALVVVLPTVADAAPLPEVITIPGGPFIIGSDRGERESAYRLDEAAYGHSITRQRGWYEAEDQRRLATTAAFTISRNLITNAQYADFIAATEHAAPEVDAATWASYGLIHPYPRTRRHAWRKRRPPPGREEHPVVLVSHHDALAYAAWLGHTTGRNWRLPSEKEWQKAVRGSDGARFPWGNHFDPMRLNSADQGPFDTMPVGSFPRGASPYGLLDGAGQVFEWTATPGAKGKFLVKGGSWDDKGCGVCRAAARHLRPADLKHILIGFRLVRE